MVHQRIKEWVRLRKRMIQEKEAEIEKDVERNKELEKRKR